MLTSVHGLALSVTAAAVPPLPKGEARAFRRVLGSPTRKDSLRPEGDVAFATEGGWLSAQQTERLKGRITCPGSSCFRFRDPAVLSQIEPLLCPTSAET